MHCWKRCLITTLKTPDISSLKTTCFLLGEAFQGVCEGSFPPVCLGRHRWHYWNTGPSYTLAVSGHTHFLSPLFSTSSLGSPNTPWTLSTGTHPLHSTTQPWPSWGNSKNVWCQLRVSSPNSSSKFGFPSFFHMFFPLPATACAEKVIHPQVLDWVCLPPGGWQREGHTVGDPLGMDNRIKRDDGIKLTNQNSLYWRNMKIWYIWNEM